MFSAPKCIMRKSAPLNGPRKRIVSTSLGDKGRRFSLNKHLRKFPLTYTKKGAGFGAVVGVSKGPSTRFDCSVKYPAGNGLKALNI